MISLLLGVLFATAPAELEPLRPQPLPPVRILESDGSISDLRVKTAGQGFAFRLAPPGADPAVSVIFHPDRVWRQWRTDARGHAALQLDFGEPATVYFVNRDGEVVFQAGLQLDAPTFEAILRACATSKVSASRDYYSGPGRMRARLEGIDAPLEFASVRCSNCHGADGSGIPRGASKGTDIRPAALGGRRSASGALWSYDEAGFCAAVRTGIDGSGRSLDPAMPRYEITRSQCKMLWEYVSQLSSGTSTMRHASAPASTTAHAK